MFTVKHVVKLSKKIYANERYFTFVHTQKKKLEIWSVGSQEND